MASYVTALQLADPSTYRYREAVKELKKMQDRVDYTITDGVMRWDSNGNVPPKDYVELAQYFLGDKIDIDKCDMVRDEQQDKAIFEYRVAMASRTPEEIAEQQAEARSAHGPGVELVNILTGEKYIT